ncbi:MAG: hypothetical protein V3V35_04435, partial [Dehalococcoidia bacterium]
GGVVEVDDAEPRIPPDELRSLFGPEVDGALATLAAEMEKQRRDERSELMQLLISPRSSAFMGPFPKDPSEVGAARGGDGA